MVDGNPRNSDEQVFWDNAFVEILGELVEIDSLRSGGREDIVKLASELASFALIERRKKAIA